MKQYPSRLSRHSFCSGLAVKPSLHSQVKLPTVLRQRPFSQMPGLVWHSFSSMQPSPSGLRWYPGPQMHMYMPMRFLHCICFSAQSCFPASHSSSSLHILLSSLRTYPAGHLHSYDPYVFTHRKAQSRGFWAHSLISSQVIIGPGSNPSSQVHSKPPITFLQVPFPQGLPTEHSSVSTHSFPSRI